MPKLVEAECDCAAWLVREKVLEPLDEAVDSPAKRCVREGEGQIVLGAVVREGAEVGAQRCVGAELLVAHACHVPLAECCEGVVAVELRLDVCGGAEAEELLHLLRVVVRGGGEDASSPREINLQA